jgi:hypothetical protein
MKELIQRGSKTNLIFQGSKGESLWESRIKYSLWLQEGKGRRYHIDGISIWKLWVGLVPL